MASPSKRIDLLAPPADGEPEEYQALRRFLDGGAGLPAYLDEPAIEAVVEALIGRGEAERLGQLTASKDKAIAKAARRGIHKLRTRGVHVEVARPAAAASARPAAEAEPETPSLITAPLRDGESLVWYTFTTPSGRVQICQASLNERAGSEHAGLARFEVYRASRKQWRGIERSIETESKLPVTRVPTPYARWLIEEAYQATLASGRTPPREYAEARAMLEPAVPVDRHPGLDVSSEEEVRAIGDPERALELPEARSWIPDEDSLRELLRELDQLGESKLVLDERQQAERRDQAVRQAAARALQAGLRARLSRRLLDTAYFITRASLDGPKGARDYAADAALAVAGALHMEDPSIAPEDNRIARRLFARIAEQLRRPPAESAEASEPGQGNPGEGGGLLITP